MVESFLRLCLRRRVWVAGLLLVVSVAAGFGLRNLRFDNSLEIWFLEDDPGIQRYRQFLEIFGTDEIVLLAWRCDDAFSDQTLTRLASLERALAELPDVLAVRSLASAAVPRDEDDELATSALFDPRPLDPRLRRLRARAALASPLLTSSLLAGDGHAVGVVVEVAHREGEFEYKRRLLSAIEAVVAREPGPTIAVTGTLVLDRAFFDSTERDMLVFVPVLFAVLCLSMLVLFGRLSAVFIPLTVVSLGLLWTLGLQGLLGWKVTVVSSVLAPLLLAMGIADAVHVLSEYHDQLRGSSGRREAAVQALLAVFKPCLFTSLTTAAGFLSLTVSPIRPVAQMGVLAAAGVLLTLGVTVVLVPLLLSLIPQPPAAYLARRERGRLVRALGWLAGGSRRRHRLSLMLAAGLAAVAGAGLGSIRVGTNMLEFFPPADPVRQTTETVDRLLGGSVSVEYLITADGERGYLTPERLARIDRFADYLRREPNVVGVHGLTEVLRELDAAVRGVPPAEGRVPDRSDLLAQYLLLIEGHELYRRYVRQGGQVGRFSLRVSMIGSEVLAQRVPEIDAFREREIETEGFRLPGTGMVPLMNRMERHLLHSQLASFGLALVVISLMMMAVLGSVRLGLLGMIPNLAPVLVTLGVMGWVGIRLDIGTVMIASVVLGLVVDDSIHLLARLQRELPAAAGDLDLALARAIRQVGQPIVITSGVLMLGFWTLLFASFQPNIYFGLLSGVTIFTALVADLVVLPAVLRLVRPRIRTRPAQPLN